MTDKQSSWLLACACALSFIIIMVQVISHPVPSSIPRVNGHPAALEPMP